MPLGVLCEMCIMHTMALFLAEKQQKKRRQAYHFRDTNLDTGKRENLDSEGKESWVADYTSGGARARRMACARVSRAIGLESSSRMPSSLVPDSSTLSL